MLDVTVDATETEFLREYGPEVTFWQLTTLGEQRLEVKQLPPNLPIRAPGLMRLIKRLGIAEDDELADYMGYSLEALKTLLTRLMGYGYVEVVGEPAKK